MSKRGKTNSATAGDVLTASEVARWLRIPKSTLYKLCQEHRIPTTKIGRHWRFSRRLLEEWLQAQMRQNEADK